MRSLVQKATLLRHTARSTLVVESLYFWLPNSMSMQNKVQIRSIIIILNVY